MNDLWMSLPGLGKQNCTIKLRRIKVLEAYCVSNEVKFSGSLSCLI